MRNCNESFVAERQALARTDSSVRSFTLTNVDVHDADRPDEK